MPGKNKLQNARFFCESCGAEVPRNTNNCPKCGRAFASILCPACGFSGEADLFKGGCPVCGYSSSPSGKARKGRNTKESKKTSGGGLPLWLYIFTAAAFTAILAAIFLRLFG